MTPAELAAVLGVAPRTVVRMCRAGRIPRARRLSATLWRIPESAAAAFLVGCEVRR
jgi:excisionase family DNA binding protein